MLQIATFWDTYSINPPVYIHMHNKCSTLKIFDNIFIEDAMLKKA